MRRKSQVKMWVDEKFHEILKLNSKRKDKSMLAQTRSLAEELERFIQSEREHEEKKKR